MSELFLEPGEGRRAVEVWRGGIHGQAVVVGQNKIFHLDWIPDSPAVTPSTHDTRGWFEVRWANSRFAGQVPDSLGKSPIRRASPRFFPIRSAGRPFWRRGGLRGARRLALSGPGCRAAPRRCRAAASSAVTAGMVAFPVAGAMAAVCVAAVRANSYNSPTLRQAVQSTQSVVSGQPSRGWLPAAAKRPQGCCPRAARGVGRR